ncbi:helix-turn-helix transcriptional regulator [Nocardia sp. CY41]|uniref:helix-turn-helix transcriptional regulator n=1 Tax=Nocardia sp. CY41 TaxID=2608686 RepID=UPI001F2D2B11|nr:helix-turn-helix domain-containing protein [Nocardia sp. CY41]
MDALASDAQVRWLTRAEVAQMFGVPVKTVAEWASKGTGPDFYKIGRYARYKLSDCLTWAESQKAVA